MLVGIRSTFTFYIVNAVLHAGVTYLNGARAGSFVSGWPGSGNVVFESLLTARCHSQWRYILALLAVSIELHATIVPSTSLSLSPLGFLLHEPASSYPLYSAIAVLRTAYISGTLAISHVAGLLPPDISELPQKERAEADRELIRMVEINTNHTAVLVDALLKQTKEIVEHE